MQKTILITGSTDGIGLETAKMLCAQGHTVLIHGRSEGKITAAEKILSEVPGGGHVESYMADLSSMGEVKRLADEISKHHTKLDVVINNAGVLNVADPRAPNGMDVRFVVNTLAPYLLTKRLLRLMDASGRVVNLSSAAQAPVDIDALAGKTRLDDMGAYAQSKLALTMWSRSLGMSLGTNGPVIVSVNPGSLLATKMVKESFGVSGGDVGKGARILCSAALDDAFADMTGQYFDNDSGQFASPHTDALDAGKVATVIAAIEEILSQASA